jgi:radical SAM superfamily enzyme YgiQ (UPF0313 family)/protein-L-isoaspartate O-methyltransferase
MTTREPALLLISPGIIKWTDVDFGLPHLVALGGWVRETLGVRVEILDLGYEACDQRELLRRLEALGPFLAIGVSCYSSFDYRRVVALARFLERAFPGVPLLAGGYHASAVPQDLLPPHAPFGAVVVGEGERPLQRILEDILGGSPPEGEILGPEPIPSLDALPPYAWELLDRYWPRADRLGRKLQIHLSRGCPYRCAFCMERAKGEASWRAFSPARALDELERLAARVELAPWMVNIADPLFGFQRRWRREVLEGVVQRGLRPRQFWTLTRADDLGAEDVALLARGRFSIGIGLESGSPDLLRVIGKTHQPERYLEAMLRLAGLAREHGLSWAANVIVGHPGETPASMETTARFVQRLYLEAPETCGWLSIDPFRLYPGSGVHGELERYAAEHGAVFHAPAWWRGWYDHAFRAEWVDPGHALDFATRVRRMHALYGPLVDRVQARFRGQGREIDRVFARSMAEQRQLMSPALGETLIRKAARAPRARPATASDLPLPIGLQVRDPWVRRREEAVRRMLDHGVLRSPALVEALLAIGPEGFMVAAQAEAVLLDRSPEPGTPGLPPAAPGFRTLAAGLEVLQPGPGERVADLAASSGWVAALLARLVGSEGRVAVVPRGRSAEDLQAALAPWPQVRVTPLGPSRLVPGPGPWDALWLGAALPRQPAPIAEALAAPHGRALLFLGPRFRHQDMVLVGVEGSAERPVGRSRLASLGGPWGWLPWPGGLAPVPVEAVVPEARPAPALAFHVLRWLDLGADAASIHDPGLPDRPWLSALSAAWALAPRRLHLQVMPLRFREPEGLIRALRSGSPRPLRGPRDAGLALAFADALEAEAPAFVEGWTPALPPAAAGVARAVEELRGLLYQGQDREPPPLRLLHCAALGRAGRATEHDGERLVAVDLGQPLEHALMQVLHEEIHPVTDPLVRAEWEDPAAQDTRAGSPGHALHQQLESVAIAATQALLEARAPRWLPAFEAWLLGLSRAGLPRP